MTRFAPRACAGRAGIALWSVLLALATFGFVSWQTANVLLEEVAETLRLEVRAAAADPAAAGARVDTRVAMDLHTRHAAGLFATDGRRIAGNILFRPADLAPDGDATRVPARVDLGERAVDDEIWAAALALPDGRIVVIAHDTDEIDRVRATRPAQPATRTSPVPAVEAATPTIRLAVETRPSLAPSTAARGQPMRSMRCLSAWTGRMVVGISGTACAAGAYRSAVIHNGVLDAGTHRLSKPFRIERAAEKLRVVLDG